MLKWSPKVVALVTLALAQFASLSEAEFKMLCAAAEGEIATCGPDIFFLNPERDIRSALVRWLLLNPDAAAYVDPRGVQVSAARLTGELNLSFATIHRPLTLLNCRIVDPISLLYASMPLLSLTGSFVTDLLGDGVKIRGSLFLNTGFRADGECAAARCRYRKKSGMHRGNIREPRQRQVRASVQPD